MMRGKAGWTNQSLKRLWQMSLSLEECDFDNLRRGQLRVELQMLEATEKCLADVTAKLNEHGQQYPVCLKGKRACPSEDCGGVWGYYDLLEAIKHPDNPDSEELLEWAGEFDPEEFDLDRINSYLSKMR